ncbi:hypothetical protein BC830DRAFT_126610 [Chytriomyces sp. MP71]|nr:hypothetical protein BC830DRAFT_126610 [Chytriomyces sp. MP71]
MQKRLIATIMQRMEIDKKELSRRDAHVRKLLAQRDALSSQFSLLSFQAACWVIIPSAQPFYDFLWSMCLCATLARDFWKHSVFETSQAGGGKLQSSTKNIYIACDWILARHWIVVRTALGQRHCVISNHWIRTLELPSTSLCQQSDFPITVHVFWKVAYLQIWQGNYAERERQIKDDLLSSRNALEQMKQQANDTSERLINEINVVRC